MANRDAKSWAAIVAEAEIAGVPHKEIAAKHGVTVAALKYHLYQTRQREAGEPRVLPVRVGDESRTFVVEVGTARLRFAEGCEPSYVAAVLSAVIKTC
ncbi:MAG: hypothetical protein ACOY0T_31290 [Myxococcota bacterium]